MMEPRPGVLTVKQTAKVLQVSTGQVYRLLEDEEIPGAMKIGESWRISASRLYQWIDGRWPQKGAPESGSPAQIASQS